MSPITDSLRPESRQSEAVIQTDFNLSSFNTMALSCTASEAVILEHEHQVETLFNNQTTKEQTPWLVLSSGSNVILPSRLDALVILPRFEGIEVIDEGDEVVEIEVMAGENWHNLVMHTVKKGWYGLENLALIPGLVGASPVQNIGAYGVQLEDCLTQVTAYHIPSRSWQTLSANDCGFAYRDSIFKQQPNTWLITRIRLALHKNVQKINASYGDVLNTANEIASNNQLNKDNTPTPLDVMNAIIQIRQRKLPDPAVLANTGSFFKNPIIDRKQYEQLLTSFPDLPKYDIDSEQVKVPAGWLIDRAGLKGKGIGSILTHAKQALVLTNHAPLVSTQADIANTRDLIIRTVADKFGINLVPEPVWIKENGQIL